MEKEAEGEEEGEDGMALRLGEVGLIWGDFLVDVGIDTLGI